MKKLLFLFVSLLVGGTGALFAQVLDVPVAKVELYTVDIITQRELRQELTMASQQLQQNIPVSQRKQFLEARIGELLVAQAAKHAKVEVSQADLNNALGQKKLQIEQLYSRQISDADFQRLIESQGMSWTDYKDQVRRQLLEQKYIRQVQASYFTNLAEPTDAQIRQFYDDNATRFTNPAMIRFDYIAIDIRNDNDKQRAEALKKINGLYQEIRNGKTTFDKLLQNSVNEVSYTGGDFGYLARTDARAAGVFGQDFVDAVFALKLHEISRVIPSRIAYYICRVTDKRPPKILTLDDPVYPGVKVTVRDQINQYLMNQTQQKAFAEAAQNLIDQLKKQASIKIYEDNLNW